MRISQIKFIKHDVLEGLNLDFCINEIPMPTILIAGENGTGKTTVLNAIYSLSVIEPSRVKDDEHIYYEVTLSDVEKMAIARSQHVQIGSGSTLENKLEIDFIGEGKDWNKIKITGYVNGSPINLPGHLFSDQDIRKKFKLLYSNVAINFDPKALTSVTAKNIDDDHKSKITNQNTATEITQLLIDIQALDDADLSTWVRNNLGQAPTEEVVDQRIKRFSQAFSLMFNDKKYKEIINDNGQKKVVFTENNRDTFIESLSSGEKQIVFRGGFFLKDAGTIIDCISIIDEPEISLHPEWQMKILSFYKEVLGVESDSQHSQLIVATHSPFILHNDSRLNDKIIILNKDSNGRVVANSEPTFYGWSYDKIVKDAFNISLSQNAIPTVFVEGETDEKYLIAAASQLEIPLANLDIKWVGRLNKNGNAEFTGDKALNHTAAFLKSNPAILNRPIILLYDSDTNKPEENFENLFVRRMDLITENVLIKKGIENLLNIPDDFDFSSFYDEKEKIDDYGVPSILRTLNKNRLCDYLILEVQQGKMIDIFINFNKTFQNINTAVEVIDC